MAGKRKQVHSLHLVLLLCLLVQSCSVQHGDDNGNKHADERVMSSLLVRNGVQPLPQHLTLPINHTTSTCIALSFNMPSLEVLIG